MTSFEVFLVATPGLDAPLLAEARACGFDAQTVPGGVTFQGGWQDVWRANLHLRGATRVLARIGSFMAFHLAQLDKRASKFDWASTLRKDIPVRVEVTCRKSKIYHAGAAQQRIENALTSQGFTLGDGVSLKVRIEDNRVTLSLDTSGESLHKRGHKPRVNKAPMRETLAAMMLAECGYRGDEPVVDLMCGSGTFLIEAAEIATGLLPGRSRSFAFEHLASFDADTWAQMKDVTPRDTPVRFFGADRDQGAVQMAQANGQAAGVDHLCQFQTAPFSAATAPTGPPGLVILNPPYGARIGKKHMLYGLYAGLGSVLRAQFSGWRIGMVTSEPGLARTMDLPFAPTGPVIAHGGLKVRLYQTKALD